MIYCPPSIDWPSDEQLHPVDEDLMFKRFAEVNASRVSFKRTISKRSASGLMVGLLWMVPFVWLVSHVVRGVF